MWHYNRRLDISVKDFDDLKLAEMYENEFGFKEYGLYIGLYGEDNEKYWVVSLEDRDPLPNKYKPEVDLKFNNLIDRFIGETIIL